MDWAHMVPSKSDGLLLLLGSTALAFHFRTSWEDLVRELLQVLHKAAAYEESPLSESEAARVEEELVQVRLQMFMKLAHVLHHFSFLTMLVGLADFLRGPSWFSACFLSLAVLTYLIYQLVVSGRVAVKHDATLKLLCVVLNSIVLSALLATTIFVEKDSVAFLARFGLCQGAQILLGVVFAQRRTGALALCYAAAFTMSTVAVLGQEVLSSKFLLEQAFQAAIAICLPSFVEAAIRDRIVASCRSKDSDSLIYGFRQMLKGICDGELLLDSGYRVCGSADCLQRLLVTKEDFVGRALQDLIDGKDDIENFEKFVAAAEVIADSPEAAPRCLRVPLKAPCGRIVSVDVCHVPLPQLYGQKSLHHLLSLTEDMDARKEPEAVPVPPVTSDLPQEVQRPESVRSAASSDTCIEFYEELAEMTLIVNGSTELLDIEEAHLRFERQTHQAKFSMGMPSLKRFARPLDWHGIDVALRRYARQVSRGGAATEKVLAGVKLGVPGEPRKQLLARHATLSSPFVRTAPDEPVYLSLHLQDFRGERLREPEQRLEGVEEDRSPQAHASAAQM